eukprot:11076939-Karenia_brevis.AAC.1
MTGSVLAKHAESRIGNSSLFLRFLVGGKTIGMQAGKANYNIRRGCDVLTSGILVGGMTSSLTREAKLPCGENRSDAVLGFPLWTVQMGELHQEGSRLVMVAVLM